MTDDEQWWLSCPNAHALWGYLGPKPTERQLRLFCCACCYASWGRLQDEGSRTAVRLAELHADGSVDVEVLRDVARRLPHPDWPLSGAEQFNWKLVTRGIAADVTDLRSYVWMGIEPDQPELTAARVASFWVQDGTNVVAGDIQAVLFRDIVGNPFRPVAFEPAWRTEAVVALARGVYEDRAFDRLPVLADALDDAGCAHPDILAHCRGDGPHVRGCWVVDLVLGKA